MKRPEHLKLRREIRVTVQRIETVEQLKKLLAEARKIELDLSESVNPDQWANRLFKGQCNLSQAAIGSGRSECELKKIVEEMGPKNAD